MPPAETLVFSLAYWMLFAADRPGRPAQHGQVHPVQPAHRPEPACRQLAGKDRRTPRRHVSISTAATIRLVDLPGTYSLTANSPEEVIAREFILREKPAIVVAVVSAANLERSLYLVAELICLAVPSSLP